MFLQKKSTNNCHRKQHNSDTKLSDKDKIHRMVSVNTEKTMSVTNGNDGFITISLQEYVNGINYFECSMDALAICNQLGVTKENHWSIAVKSTIKYLEALRGDANGKKERDTLNYYKIGLSYNIRKNIAYIKWILYANAKYRNFDDEYAGLIGIVAGVCLYINEQYLINKHYGIKIENLTDFCKAYVVNEF